MNERRRELGVVGLGRIGGGLALQAMARGYRVIGLDRQPAEPELTAAGLVVAREAAQLSELARPRVIFVYVPAGEAVDAVLDTITPALEEGDVVVDGGNSYWGDSLRRYRRLAAADGGPHFVDLGTSGGVRGARGGACFMAGGTPEAYRVIEPVLRDLAAEGGVVHCGAPGTGHFVKLVHNGIEFGMLQALGEGLALLERHDERLPVADILHTWRHGSVIRSWLVDLLAEEYSARGGAAAVPVHVEDTGEVNWLLEDALRMEVPIPVIAQALMELLASRDTQRMAPRAIAMMRHGFGGHPLGPSEPVRSYRKSSRLRPEEG